MRKNQQRRVAALVAALPASLCTSAWFGLMPHTASAAPTISVTNQGTARDSIGHTATGWTGYLLTVTADPGQTVTALDFGSSTASTNGIFGPLLQNYWNSKASNIGQTPLSHDQNGQGPDLVNGGSGGLDSHFLGDASQLAIVNSPFENSDHINPGNGVPANDASNSDFYGTGSFLHGVYGIPGAIQRNSFPTAYLVLRNGTGVNFSFDVAEQSGSSHVQSGVIGTPPVITVTPVASGVPSGFGSRSTTATGTVFTPSAPKANAINLVSDGHGGLSQGFATNVDGDGFSFLGYLEITADAASVGAPQYIALELTNHGFAFDPNRMQSTINLINSYNVGVTASAMSPALQAQYPGYNVLLTVPTPAADEYLAWNFNPPTFFEVGLGDVAAGIAIPEPTSTGLLTVVATATLLRRRGSR
jgi:hypothetical protein